MKNFIILKKKSNKKSNFYFVDVFILENNILKREGFLKKEFYADENTTENDEIDSLIRMLTKKSQNLKYTEEGRGIVLEIGDENQLKKYSSNSVSYIMTAVDLSDLKEVSLNRKTLKILYKKCGDDSVVIYMDNFCY